MLAATAIHIEFKQVNADFRINQTTCTTLERFLYFITSRGVITRPKQFHLLTSDPLDFQLPLNTHTQPYQSRQHHQIQLPLKNHLPQRQVTPFHHLNYDQLSQVPSYYSEMLESFSPLIQREHVTLEPTQPYAVYQSDQQAPYQSLLQQVHSPADS